jgi:oxygen-independent coproporphyrinogen III oxidase
MTLSNLPRSVYVHVPFCRHRCGYCDFTLVASRDDLIEQYFSALEMEFATVVERPEIDTLFIGGGTPTHLSPDQLSRLLGLLLARFRFTEEIEVSVEANPADFCQLGLGEDKIAALSEGGVNRISLGVQSFETPILHTLERDHVREDIHRAVDVVRERVMNISFDLIFGVPGQSLSDWQSTLEEAVSLAPEHISTYGLTIEKGTTFWSKRRKGDLILLPEETEREMYSLAMERLPDAGFQQYELSNFAQPGRTCQHNEVYWTGLPFYGFGPGAARYIDGIRTTNHRSVTSWIKRVLANRSMVGDEEQLSPEDRAREILVISLRRTEGISKSEFHIRTGYFPDEISGEAISRNKKVGLLEETATHLRLSREGRFLADTVIVDCL